MGDFYAKSLANKSDARLLVFTLLLKIIKKFVFLFYLLDDILLLLLIYGIGLN